MRKLHKINIIYTMAKKHVIKPGERFGFLTVIKEGERLILPSKQVNRTVICKCDCGNIKQIRLLHLVRSRIISCGCENGINNEEKHLKIYTKWKSINYRTDKTKIDNYCTKKNITVCDEWKNDYYSFKNWCLSNGFKDHLHIDRIDNNKGYSPDNCRFVTNIENVNNRDNTFYVIYNGIKYPFMELIHTKKLWLSSGTIRSRILRGWSVDDAFNIPVKTGKYFRNTFTEKDALDKMQIKNLKIK